MTTSHLACEGGGEAMSRTCNLVRKSTVDHPHPFKINYNNHILFELHTVIKINLKCYNYRDNQNCITHKIIFTFIFKIENIDYRQLQRRVQTKPVGICVHSRHYLSHSLPHDDYT